MQRVSQKPSSRAPEPEIPADVRRAFKELDINGTGRLELVEIYNGLPRLGVNLDMSAAKSVLAKYDTNKDASLNLVEFNALVQVHSTITR